MTLLSQKTEKAQSASETTDVQENKVVTVFKKMEISNLENNDAIFNEMAENDGVEISSDYLKLVEGETKDFICAGIEQAEFERKDGEIEMREVVALYDRSKKRFIAAQTTLVGTIKSYVDKNPEKKLFPVRIECTGKKDIAGGGFYYTYKVMVF